MSRKLNVLATALIGLGLLGGMSVLAQTTSTAPATAPTTSAPAKKLSTQYTKLAGSQENADALISGLRDDKPITLTSGTTGGTTSAPSATFTPATGKLGYGNINIALSLAKTELTKQGITNPTPEQLAAALNGGTVTGPNGTVTLNGVLAQRQSGMGWGQIANSMGVKLGAVVSASKTGKTPASDSQQAKSKSTSSHSKNELQASKSSHSNSGSGNSGGSSSSHGGGGGGGGGSKK